MKVLFLTFTSPCREPPKLRAYTFTGAFPLSFRLTFALMLCINSGNVPFFSIKVIPPRSLWTTLFSTLLPKWNSTMRQLSSSGLPSSDINAAVCGQRILLILSTLPVEIAPSVAETLFDFCSTELLRSRVLFLSFFVLFCHLFLKFFENFPA